MTAHDPALVERAARAMFMARYVVGDQRINDGLWERTSEIMREDCRADVRTVLDAITVDREIVELPAPESRLAMSNACPFCKPNWPNLDIVERWMGGSVAIINPLNPVTDGHVLVIHWDHDDNAAASRDASRRACLLMAVAADYVNVNGLQANIITSIGADATQTVHHTHLHVVPRRAGDGLHLPWTGQMTERA